jgi:hypothetical protein
VGRYIPIEGSDEATSQIVLPTRLSGCFRRFPNRTRSGPDLTLGGRLGDLVRPPRVHDRKGPVFYTFAHKYYCFGLIFFREKIHMGLSEER